MRDVDLYTVDEHQAVRVGFPVAVGYNPLHGCAGQPPHSLNVVDGNHGQIGLAHHGE